MCAAAVTTIGLLMPAPGAVAATACVFNDNPTTQTRGLAGDCDLGATLSVADGWTIDGNGHTITVDAGGGFAGPIIASATGTAGGAPAAMDVKHLTIQAVGFGNATGRVDGILFDGAKGSVSDVRILGVSQGTAGDNGYGIEADNSTVGATFGATDQVQVVNGTTISGYQRAAVYAHGDLKLTVLRANFANPDAVSGQDVYGVLATDGVHGSIKETQINLTDTEPATASDFSAGVRIIGTRRLEVRRNVFSGSDADFGVSVENPAQAARTTAVVDCNYFSRNDSSASDTYGVAVGRWDDGSKTGVQLTNSTFVGNWKTDSGTISGTNVTAGQDNVFDGNCPPSAATAVAAGGGDGKSKVTWQAATPLPYAPVTGYQVKAKTAGSAAITQSAGPNATSAVLKGLHNGHIYVVTVTAQSNGGATAATTHLYPTRVLVGAKPGTIHRGDTATLHGKLATRDPHGKLAQRKVQIWAKPLGGSWAKIATVHATSAGEFAQHVKPTKRTSYKVVYAGHPDLASSAKTTVVVKH